MKVGPPLMVPLKLATSGLTAPFGRWVASPKGKLNVEPPLTLAVPVMDCRLVNCIGRRKLARTILSSRACS